MPSDMDMTASSVGSSCMLFPPTPTPPTPPPPPPPPPHPPPLPGSDKEPMLLRSGNSELSAQGGGARMGGRCGGTGEMGEMGSAPAGQLETRIDRVTVHCSPKTVQKHNGDKKKRCASS
jgi:hypothetical protein